MMNAFDLSRLTETMFRRADGVVWDALTGKMGIITDEGIATLEGTGDDATININMMSDFGVAIPAYAQSTQKIDVKEGDIIITGAGKISWVIERKETENGVKYKTMKPSGDTGTWVPPKKTIMGMDTGVMVLRSLMSLSPGGADGLQNMQQMLMMMAMMGGGKANAAAFDKIMPLMLMGGIQGGAGQNPMQMMLMMQMMQGGIGGLQFDNRQNSSASRFDRG